MHYYREYKDQPDRREEVEREDVVRALESHGYYAAGTVMDMERDAQAGLFPYRQTDWAVYSISDR